MLLLWAVAVFWMGNPLPSWASVCIPELGPHPCSWVSTSGWLGLLDPGPCLVVSLVLKPTLVECGFVFDASIHVIVWAAFCLVGVNLLVGHSSMLDGLMDELGNLRYMRTV